MSKELDEVIIEISRLREDDSYKNKCHELHEIALRDMQNLHEEKLRLEGRQQ